MRDRLAALAVALTLAAAALGYTQSTVTDSLFDTPLLWPNPASIRFAAQNDIAADLRNADNRPFISRSSNPIAALEGALGAWSGAPESALRFEPLERTDAGFDATDGRNVFVFDDTPAIRALTDAALAVTAVTFTSDGAIIDADILFSPNARAGNNQVPFSTDLALNTYDLQDVATHELGVAVGAGGSPVIGSAMYPFAEPGLSFRRRLSSDDLAFLRDVYPADGVAASLGTIAGRILISDGRPATGVAVSAVDAERGVIVSTFTSFADGSYSLRVPASPTGRYFVYAEPLDGPVIPADLQRVNLAGFDTTILPRFFGGNISPQRSDVTPGRTLNVDITVQSTSRTVQIERIGSGPPGGSGAPERFGTGPIRLPSGEALDLMLVGRGIDETIAPEDIRMLAPGVTIREGSVRVDPTFRFLGAPALRFTVDVAARSKPALGSVVIVRSFAADVFTGVLVIDPTGPRFSEAGVVNAAGFAAGGLAPGSIVSIFGEELGPEEGVSAAGFDPQTGGLPTELAGVSVRFGDRPAPLFFVSAAQINLQAPFELAGQADAELKVTYQGMRSAPPRVVTIAAAQPGLFAEGGQAVAVNQDGAVNSPATPARRGETLTLYATGQGEVAPSLATGQPAPAEPLSRAVDVEVLIGGAPIPASDVLFAGLAPGFVGLLQLNIRIPADAPAGDAVAVALRIRGIESRSPAGTFLSLR